jgi:pimeloyl-ACP methyl ester carboxylesterase
VLRTGFARTDDDLQLYWRTMGPDAAPVLVCCNGVGVSTFFWKYLTHHFRDRYRIVLWDYRGHGLSSTPEDIDGCDLTIERSAKDLRCVLDHLEIHEPVILLGHSMGCQVILEYTKQYRDQVRALLPMFGTFARPLDTFMDNPNSRKIFEVVSRFAAMGGKPGSRLLRPLYASPLAFEVGRRTGLFDRYYASRQDMEMYLEHLNHMDTRVFFKMVEAIKDHDLTDFLPQVGVPTLIIAAENDLFTPLHRSRKMAELIPGSELLVIPGGSHAAIVEHPETINRRIEKFFVERVFSAKGGDHRVDPAGQQRLL